MDRSKHIFIHWSGAVFGIPHIWRKLGYVMATVKPGNDTEEFYAAVARLDTDAFCRELQEMNAVR